MEANAAHGVRFHLLKQMGARLFNFLFIKSYLSITGGKIGLKITITQINFLFLIKI